METLRLGKTEIMATKTAFGALPIQRTPMEEAVKILRSAYEGGINFFDTARAYSDSEEKLGNALADVRQHIFIATKSNAKDRKSLLKDLETSLRLLKTDYIDIYQLHNPVALEFDDPESPYAGMVEAKQKGYIRHISITNHRLDTATAAVLSGKFDTLQFPFSMLASKEDAALVALCKEKDMGFIAMKAMSGGLIRHPAATFAYIRSFGNVLPIWGIQRQRELDEFLEYEKNPPAFDEAMKAMIAKEKEELSGDFCRGCGYCLPCPVDIPIPNAARLELLMTRSPYVKFLSDEFSGQMDRIDDCIHCNHCKDHCPYGLDTPELLKKNLVWYRNFREEHAPEIPRG